VGDEAAHVGRVAAEEVEQVEGVRAQALALRVLLDGLGKRGARRRRRRTRTRTTCG